MEFYRANPEMNAFLGQLLQRFAKEGRPNLHKSISLVWVSYESQNPKPCSGQGAAWMHKKLIYPASVVKLIYACAIEVWLQQDMLVDSNELRRAQSDMIKFSSNDATSYVLDLLTGTSSGASLTGSAWQSWQSQRNLVNNWLKSLNLKELASLNCSQKTWSDGPYGRDKDFYGKYNENRNAMSAIATGKILEAIMTNELLTIKASKKLRELLSRSLDLVKRKADPENQIDGFLGEGLPQGTKLWSKAGLMSEARHDAAWFITPKGLPMLLVVFCEGKALAKDTYLLPAFADELSKWTFKK
ncbi:MULTISPECIES: serine hydrolase [Prochlorococcus]|uniref:serine hydrolase n=1 Tax=Prochlorococcus TaxID=1218 RepID=UPI00056645F3|nr:MULTISPECIES: serine hydrolase [Prochlorococcus]